jgi:hypothetical protein
MDEEKIFRRAKEKAMSIHVDLEIHHRGQMMVFCHSRHEWAAGQSVFTMLPSSILKVTY